MTSHETSTLRHISFRNLGTTEVHQRFLENDRDLQGFLGIRAKGVEAKKANQKPYRGRIHKKGKEDETGDQNADELLHLRREAAVFQDNQGKGEGDRPAKPAPEHHRLKRGGHLLGEAKLAEQGQQTKDNEHPPPKGRRYQHSQPEPLLRRKIGQKPGHGQAHQKEDQGIGPEAKLLPGFVKPVPVLRRQHAGASSTHNQGRGHHGHDPGDVKVVFPQQEGEVGQGHGQTTLRQGLPAKACEHRDEGPSQHQAYGDASEEYAEKI